MKMYICVQGRLAGLILGRLAAAEWDAQGAAVHPAGDLPQLQFRPRRLFQGHVLQPILGAHPAQHRQRRLAQRGPLLPGAAQVTALNCLAGCIPLLGAACSKLCKGAATVPVLPCPFNFN